MALATSGELTIWIYDRINGFISIRWFRIKRILGGLFFVTVPFNRTGVYAWWNCWFLWTADDFVLSVAGWKRNASTIAWRHASNPSALGVSLQEVIFKKNLKIFQSKKWILRKVRACVRQGVTVEGINYLPNKRSLKECWGKKDCNQNHTLGTMHIEREKAKQSGEQQKQL